MVIYDKLDYDITMHESRWQLLVANSLGTLGYFSCGVQWVWATIILCYPIISDKNSFLFKRDLAPVAASTTPTEPLPPVVGIILIIATVALLIMTAVTLMRLPKAVGKTGAKITHTASAAVIPTIIHHKKITKKRRLLLAYRVVQTTKAIASIIPLAALSFAPSIPTMPASVIWVVAAFCFICTTLAFSLQSLAVRCFKITTANVW